MQLYTFYKKCVTDKILTLYKKFTSQKYQKSLVSSMDNLYYLYFYFLLTNLFFIIFRKSDCEIFISESFFHYILL